MKPADQPNAVMYTGEDCYPLPVARVLFGDQPALVTAWELTEQEMTDVVKSGRIWVTLLGTAQPPISLATRCPYAAEPLDEDGQRANGAA